MEKMNTNEVGRLIRIIGIIVIIFIIFYMITMITTNDKKAQYPSAESIPSVIQYDEIILSKLYDQKENEYFVLVKGEEDPYLSLFEDLLLQFSSKETGCAYYTVDLTSAFNQRFVGEVASFDPNALQFTDTTLLKIQDHTLIEYYATSDSILEYLKAINQ